MGSTGGAEPLQSSAFVVPVNTPEIIQPRFIKEGVPHLIGVSSIRMQLATIAQSTRANPGSSFRSPASPSPGWTDRLPRRPPRTPAADPLPLDFAPVQRVPPPKSIVFPSQSHPRLQNLGLKAAPLFIPRGLCVAS